MGQVLSEADEILDRFLDYLSEIGLELYPAQEEALLEILADKNVILCTPTGSGKSLVAVGMHFKAMAEDRRSFYTSPVKALVNEKFFALCNTFHPDNVGLMTGDATVNRDAPIICCTAEIMANLALREGADADIGYAVLDEFHYYADRERGVAWQVPLLCMPQTCFMLMSATLGDMQPFEQRLTELNGRPSATVRSEDRPVPLDFAYHDIPLGETVAGLVESGKAPIYLVNFTQKGCHAEAQSLMSVNLVDKATKRDIAAAIGDFRFDTTYGKVLSRFVRHGVGVHHGGMLPKYRRLVERLAKQGLLQVVSGTDTLGVGVNIPIRTVVLTKLYKYDGERSRLLSVRDFKQICGRAGRKGYDERGSVVAQAPEHVIANLRLEAKAANDPKKRKKLVRKKPPKWGYVHYDRATFERLVTGHPEPLQSSFRVSHGMMLNLLSRPIGGCHAVKELIRGCHERPMDKHRHAKTAIQMFRSLVQAEVVTLEDDPLRPGIKRPQVNVDLQREFSLNYTLSLFVVETSRQLYPELESYPLDVLSVVEAILDDPTPVLRKQLDRVKGEAVARMKAEGIEYDERMEKLAELQYPKPNAVFIYDAFDKFVARHPWVGSEHIRPKGVAREIFDDCHDFRSFVAAHKLDRSEGSVLRYLTDVYKALVQTVPEQARTEPLRELIEFFGILVRGVDASLLQEWEQMRDPRYRVATPAMRQAQVEPTAEPPSLTTDEASFTVLLRNTIFRVVRLLARGELAGAAAEIESPNGEPAWTAARLHDSLAPYFVEHESIRTDPRARGTEHLHLVERSPTRWRVEQMLVDPDEQNDWLLELSVDLPRSDEEARPVLTLHRIGAG